MNIVAEVRREQQERECLRSTDGELREPRVVEETDHQVPREKEKIEAARRRVPEVN